MADDDIQQVCLLRGTKRGEDTAACPPRKIGRLPMCAPLALGGALAGGAHRSRLGRGLRLRRLRGLLGGFGGGSGLRCGGGRVGLGRRGLLGCGARRLRGRPWPRALRWRWSSWRSSSCAQSSSPARAFAAGALSAALAFRGSGLSCRGLRSRGLGCGHLGAAALAVVRFAAGFSAAGAASAAAAFVAVDVAVRFAAVAFLAAGFFLGSSALGCLGRRRLGGRLARRAGGGLLRGGRRLLCRGRGRGGLGGCALGLLGRLLGRLLAGASRHCGSGLRLRLRNRCRLGRGFLGRPPAVGSGSVSGLGFRSGRRRRRGGRAPRRDAALV